jgi:hypothetical protein
MPTSDLAYAAQQNKNHELVHTRARCPRPASAGNPGHISSFAPRRTIALRMYKPAAENYKLFLKTAAAGKFPDQEFQARHRLKAILPD